jgi:hypothetical protein
VHSPGHVLKRVAGDGGLVLDVTAFDVLALGGGQPADRVAEGGGRQMLILDPRTGQVLGLETTFTKDDDEYKVKAGDVMSYEAWLT